MTAPVGKTEGATFDALSNVCSRPKPVAFGAMNQRASPELFRQRRTGTNFWTPASTTDTLPPAAMILSAATRTSSGVNLDPMVHGMCVFPPRVRGTLGSWRVQAMGSLRMLNRPLTRQTSLVVHCVAPLRTRAPSSCRRISGAFADEADTATVTAAVVPAEKTGEITREDLTRKIAVQKKEHGDAHCGSRTLWTPGSSCHS